jgi:hypothetical protein
MIPPSFILDIYVEEGLYVLVLSYFEYGLVLDILLFANFVLLFSFLGGRAIFAGYAAFLADGSGLAFAQSVLLETGSYADVLHD